MCSPNVSLSQSNVTGNHLFGDSLADTGNDLLSCDGKPYHVGQPPYGKTYFHHPTGRYSDGRIMIDFIDEIKTFVPNVVGAISSAISELIQLGAKTLVVPRDLPFGCLPTFLKFFSGASTKDYEPETGCLKFLNRLVEYHDQLLWHELSQLRRSHPHATIIYADCYNTTISIYRSPRRYDEPIKNN
nr:PREDICTED: GDSL esterase/lipase At1g31550-like [Musa acuminata subsp. malaccensis]